MLGRCTNGSKLLFHIAQRLAATGERKRLADPEYREIQRAARSRHWSTHGHESTCPASDCG